MKSKRAQSSTVGGTDSEPAKVVAISNGSDALANKRKRSRDDVNHDNGDNADPAAGDVSVKKAKKSKDDKKKSKKEKESRRERKDKRKDLQDLPEGEDEEEESAMTNAPAASTPPAPLATHQTAVKKEKKDKKKREERKEVREKVEKIVVPEPERKHKPSIQLVEANKSEEKDKKKKKEKKDKKDKKSKSAENPNAEAMAEDAAKKDRHIVFVGNLPFSATIDSIKFHFSSLSPISVRCLKHKDDSNPCRGIAFVEFGKVWHQRTCLDKFHHSMFDDGISPPRRINVELTAGGGGKTQQRQDKIREKNEKLDDNRAKRIDREKQAKTNSGPSADDMGVHPSRRALAPGNNW